MTIYSRQFFLCRELNFSCLLHLMSSGRLKLFPWCLLLDHLSFLCLCFVSVSYCKRLFIYCWAFHCVTYIPLGHFACKIQTTKLSVFFILARHSVSKIDDLFENILCSQVFSHHCFYMLISFLSGSYFFLEISL